MKGILAFLLVLSMVMSTLPTTAFAADVYDNEGTVQSDAETGMASNMTVVDATTAWGTTGNTIWYVVNKNRPATISSRITVNGNVNLILADGYTLDALAGSTIGEGSSLTIF